MCKIQPERQLIMRYGLCTGLQSQSKLETLEGWNGYDVTNVDYNILSSIGRVCKDRTVCAYVCDAQEPPRSTFCGRDVDATTSPNTRTPGMCV